MSMNTLKQAVRGWVNYFRISDMKSLTKTLDGWLRRRVRMVIRKPWKRIKTKFESLRKLGLDKQKAWEYANTRKGYWRTSDSPMLHRTITNKILEKRGLIGIADTYTKC